MTISKALALPHAWDSGARPTITWPVGQLADYALELEFGAAPLVIREFADRFEAMVARVQLAERTLALVQTNPTAAVCLGGVRPVCGESLHLCTYALTIGRHERFAEKPPAASGTSAPPP